MSILCFAQQGETSDTTVAQTQASETVQDSTATAAQDSTVATIDSAKVSTDSTVAAIDTVAADSAAADTAKPEKKVKPRKKITYAEYMAKNNRKYKKKSRTLHHGLTVAQNNYHDKNYGNMDRDADWGGGFGAYYFYRRYFGKYLGIQGRAGFLYRYARWNFEKGTMEGELSSGEEFTLTHKVDRKYHNFAADLPLTGKFGYHIKGTTGYIFLSTTFGLTKPIYEMVDTENRLYATTSDGALQENLDLMKAAGHNPFPLYESHQTKKSFSMADWETSNWVGVGVESKFLSIEFQVFTIGGASRDSNHRYYHIGHDSNLTWRLFLDFSIR